MSSDAQEGTPHHQGNEPDPAAAGPRDMMRAGSAHYELVDVFTTTAFGGNPLALFPDATAIPDSWLQRIASELNLSETAFAYPIGPAEWRLRIFTPKMEHPFAGHPTIGSALILAAKHSLSSLTLQERIGAVEVAIDRPSGRAPVARLTVPAEPEERSVDVNVPDVAAMLSLESDQLEQGELGPRAMSCGVPFLFVRLTNRDALRKARLRSDRWQDLIARSWAPHIYLFTMEGRADSGSTIHSRMFAPLMGIDEDPATGGAAAALAGVLAASDPQLDGAFEWTISQGVEMGRPSIVELSAVVSKGRATQIKVGGSAVSMGRGAFDLSFMVD